MSVSMCVFVHCARKRVRACMSKKEGIVYIHMYVNIHVYKFLFETIAD